ncbi:MAG: YafY family protein [Ignavibacteria bacterium]|jgi:predicted DNA-binding transcriptional regulator YafY
MNRIDRLTAILIQLQSKRFVKIEEICERFDISRRTVYRDIRALEESGVPIGVEPGKGYFIIEGYFLPPVMFTNEEASALLLAGKLVEQMSDKSVKTEFESALTKVKSVLKTSGKDFLENLHQHVQVDDRLSKRNGSSNLLQIQNAIAEKKAIEIDYFSHYRDAFTNRVVEPIGLYYYSSAWHLIAYCRMREDYRDFRIDRIKKFNETENSFKTKKHKSLQEYIDTIIDTTVGMKKLKLAFKKDVVKYFEDYKYYYGYVSEEKNGDEIEMTFMAAEFEFVSRWVLMYGSSCRVISPPELKELAKKHIKKLAEHYK